MTPKEKAIDLINKFTNDKFFTEEESKVNAVIDSLTCVNEIINCDSYFNTLEDSKIFVNFWSNVQDELNKY